MNCKKSFKRIANKIRDRYCGGKVCTNCPYKTNNTCLNRMLCDTYLLIIDGEKKEYERQRQTS